MLHVRVRQRKLESPRALRADGRNARQLFSIRTADQAPGLAGQFDIEFDRRELLGSQAQLLEQRFPAWIVVQ
jgi:hypothetical protein